MHHVEQAAKAGLLRKQLVEPQLCLVPDGGGLSFGFACHCFAPGPGLLFKRLTLFLRFRKHLLAFAAALRLALCADSLLTAAESADIFQILIGGPLRRSKDLIELH